MSWWLAERSIDHVVLERGEVANTWRTRALGFADAAHAELAEPAARATATRATIRTASGRMAETVAFIERYAKLVSPPLRTHCR